MDEVNVLKAVQAVVKDLINVEKVVMLGSVYLYVEIVDRPCSPKVWVSGYDGMALVTDARSTDHCFTEIARIDEPDFLAKVVSFFADL